MSAEQIARYEDTAAGRFLPAWRFWAGYMLIFAVIIYSRVRPDGFWWSFCGTFLAVTCYWLLFVQYRRRSIH